MNRGMLKPSLIISVLISLLTFLFLQTRTIDVTEQNRVIVRIQDLTYQDALLNESILKSRAGRFSNYDSLTKYRLNILDHLDWFESMNSGIYGAYGNDLDKAINDTAKFFHDKIALTERFKTHNGLLKNSLHYLPTSVKENLKNSEKMHCINLIWIRYSEKFLSLIQDQTIRTSYLPSN